MGLVDDDDVPPRALQIVAVFEVALQGVDRDDGLVVVVERVMVGGNAAAHACKPHGIEPHQRNGKTVPQLLLELREHALQRHDQDAVAPAALDQLRDEHTRFERLAEPHAVGNQDALAVLPEGLQGGIELVGHQVHGRAVPDIEALVVGHLRAQVALDMEQARGIPR
jgi:hypothetical protein